MQMLNFVKIPTLLLLLQVISINAQLNYPNTVSVQTTTPNNFPSKPKRSSVTNAETVVTIVIDPLFLKSKDENGNVDKNEFSARLESGEYYSTNKCCDVFREVAQSSVPGNWKKYRCIDVNSEIMTTNKNSAVLKVVLNLKFLYTDEKEFNKSTIARTIMNNLNNGNSSEVLANNEYMGIATVVWVETNAIDVFSNKPTSSPVTNAETVVTIVTKTNFFRWRDAKGGIQIGNFLAQSDSGEYYSTNKCCDVFREVAQSSVPGNWKKYRCIDVNYEISMNLGDTVILQMMSDIQFIYSGIKKFNNWTIYGDFWEKMKRPTFKEVYHKNDFAGFDYTVSVQTYTPDNFPKKPTSSPVTNAETVLTIHVYSSHPRMNKSTSDVLKSPCFFSRNSGDLQELPRCCMLFESLIKKVVKKFSKQSECVDVESIPFNDNVNATTVKKVSKFEFSYRERMDLNSNRLTKSLDELSKQKDFQNMLRFNNISNVEYVASVQTIRHGVASKKLTSSPVTKVKTLVTIDIQPVFIRPKDPNGNVQKREFYAQSNLGVYYSTNKCCDVFKEFAQMSVPKDWENYVCTDVSDKILPWKGNKAILKVWSTLAFIYADERRLNNLTIAKNFTSNVRKDLNSTGVLLKNSLRGIKIKASVKHI